MWERFGGKWVTKFFKNFSNEINILDMNFNHLQHLESFHGVKGKDNFCVKSIAYAYVNWLGL